MSTTPLNNTTEAPQLSYFDTRMNELGITPDINTVQLWRYDADKQKNTLQPVPIFRKTDRGIDIIVYSIGRMLKTYDKEGTRFKKDYCITRLEVPIIKPNGDTIKYLMPKGVPTQPFFPPQLLDAYDKKEKIKVLYITEGYFKAFKACMHGIMCVGLPSITCMKDKESGALYEDIKQLITVCDVERIVWLCDGDFRNISGKEITEEADLYKRPQQFFNTVNTFRELLSSFENVKKYFAHVNTDNLPGAPKGIDDLLVCYADNEAEIKKEAAAFDKIKSQEYTGEFFIKMDVTYGLGTVRKYFKLDDVDGFYLYHAEKRRDLEGKKFKFNGTVFQYDVKAGKCEMIVPGEAGQYMRVGDDYFEHIQRPNEYGHIEPIYVPRQKTTITDDHTKSILKHIPRYKDFCIVPDHVNYQRIINNNYNKYHPFIHEPGEGDFTNTLDFIKHIFGEAEQKYTNQAGQPVTIKNYEIGLDYLTLLYKNPQHILPILCLVSTDRQTGKTTFANYLKELYTENMAFVGNADMKNDFNAHWASKLIICCDETKIDKVEVVEKVKSLSTAKSIMKNAKGKDQVSTAFFGKFIFLSNNEDNFILIDEEEIRFWVMKVPPIKKRNLDLLNDMRDEIPAFLHYLNNRKMATERMERHWFASSLLENEALRKLKASSKPHLEKQITLALEELFNASALDEITMPLHAIAEMVRRPNEQDYVKRILNKMGYTVGDTGRRAYPVKQVITEADGMRITTHPVKFCGRYYTFKREDFTTTTADLFSDNNTDTNTTEAPPVAGSDDLPF